MAEYTGRGPGHVEIENAWIPLSDGACLAARLWLPAGVEPPPVPAILEYVPYRKDDWTAHDDSTRHPYFADHGYASVRVDIRGCGDSDGVLLGEYLAQEQDDALEVIAWIARQPWCDGRVGMIGYSWGGFAGLQVAARRPPELGAVVTVNSTDDRYLRDCHYSGGCLLGSDMLKWATTMLAYAVQPPDPRFVGDHWRDMWMERLAQTPVFAEEWLAHQRRDEFWRHGSVSEDYAAIECPVLAIGGWADPYRDSIPPLLEHLDAPVSAIVGPWAHMIPAPGVPGPSVNVLGACVSWFDRWLKDDPDAMDDSDALIALIQERVPAGRSNDDRAGRWIAEESWPAAGSRSEPLRLGPDGTLGETAPSAGTVELLGDQTCGWDAGAWCPVGLPDELPDDQAHDDGCSLTFDTAPLDEPLEILGVPVLRLRVASDRPQALVAARLEEALADGSSVLIAWGLLNLAYRDGFDRPEPLEPGHEYDVAMELGFAGHRFSTGSCVRLAISPTYWPHAWPSPSPVTLKVDAAASTLELPVHDLHSGRDVDLGQPQWSRPLDAGPDEAATHSLSSTVDPETGVLRHEHQSVQRRSIPPTGETLVELASDVYEIAGDDPLSARVACVRDLSLTREEWAYRIVVESELTSDASTFTVATKMVAYEGDATVYESISHRQIPRDHL